MRKTAVFIALALLLAIGATPVLANGIPKLPHAFYGSVTINGAPASAGTQVSATVGIGDIISTQNPVTTVGGSYGIGSSYLLVQGYDIPDGATITFYVNGMEAEGATAIFKAGGGPTEQNLVLVSDIAAQKVETVPAGQTGHVIDFSTEANTTITVNTTGEVTITVKKYYSNPHPGAGGLPANMLPRFIDISVDNPDAVVWPIYVEQTYTDAEVVGLDEANLAMYYFQAGAWHRCSDTGVNTAANYVWANMTRSELSGSPISVGGPAAAAPPSAPPAGGGGGGPEIVRVTLTGLISDWSLRVDPLGTVQATCRLTSSDGKLTLDIVAGTVLRDSAGGALAVLAASGEPYPPAPPEGKVIIAAYSLTPDGATFSPPIIMTIKYDPDVLPEGCAEEDLCIAYWDGKKWCYLGSVCHAAKDEVSCQVSHFTTFGIIGTIRPPELAAFSIGKLAIEPAEVSPNQPVTIIATVSNSGDKEGSYSVALSVNEVKEAEKSVTVAAGGSQDVSFTVTRAEVGSYSVTVNGLSGEFTVTTVPALPVPTPTPTVAKPINWPLIGGIIAGVIVLIVVIFSVARRRA
jgi:hypothetical protein